MARRRRDSDIAARRRGGTRRRRSNLRCPASTRSRAGAERKIPSGRVVTLTAARRRAVARRRLVNTTPTVPSETPGVAHDFHLAACVACARAGGRVIMNYWGNHFLRGVDALRCPLRC